MVDEVVLQVVRDPPSNRTEDMGTQSTAICHYYDRQLHLLPLNERGMTACS